MPGEKINRKEVGIVSGPPRGCVTSEWLIDQNIDLPRLTSSVHAVPVTEYVSRMAHAPIT